MEIKFDPDDVELTDDPEYAALIARVAPANKTKWAVGDAARAKRAEMLEIDREMNRSWERAMEKLSLQDLTDAEFTAQRMMRLKRWTQERKRRQHNLHFKYDPSRRNPKLVERDAERALAANENRLIAIQQRLWERFPHLAPAGQPIGEVHVQPPVAQPQERLRRPLVRRQPRDEAFIPAPTPDGTEPVPVPESAAPFIPEYLHATTFQMIVADTGLTDPARETDERILQAYEAKGMTGYPAEYMLAQLRGRPAPPHPDDEPEG